MVVTEIRNIPYFDGHCDTIYECMGKGRSLRENSGHVDLMRGQRYGRRAQFFALFDNVRELPEGTAWGTGGGNNKLFVDGVQQNWYNGGWQITSAPGAALLLACGRVRRRKEETK